MPEPRDLAFLIGKGNGGCRPARETGPCKIKRAAALVMLQPPTPARELVTWIHAPLQPLMRSPLSRLQTPTAPRRAVGFFRSGCPLGHPLEPIARPTSDWPVLFCQPFQPSTHVKIKAVTLSVNARFWCNCGNPAENFLLWGGGTAALGCRQERDLHQHFRHFHLSFAEGSYKCIHNLRIEIAARAFHDRLFGIERRHSLAVRPVAG